MPLPKCVRVLEEDTQSREALEADGWRYVETLVEMKRATEMLGYNRDVGIEHWTRSAVAEFAAEHMGMNRLHSDGKNTEATLLRKKVIEASDGQVLTFDRGAEEIGAFLLREGNRIIFMASSLKGAGTILVKQFISCAYRDGYDEVFAGTQDINDEALALYGGLGFRTYRRRVTYHKD